MVPLAMTLSDLWPGSQGHDIVEVKYLKNGGLDKMRSGADLRGGSERWQFADSASADQW